MTQNLKSSVEMQVNNLDNLVKRLEAVVLKLESKTNTVEPTQSTHVEPTLVDPTLVEGALQFKDAIADFLASSIDPLINQQLVLLSQIVNLHQNAISCSKTCRKPSRLASLESNIQLLVALKDKNRASPFFNHLSAVAEGAPAFLWLLISPLPAPFINDMKDSAMFYVNKVIREFKGKYVFLMLETILMLFGQINSLLY